MKYIAIADFESCGITMKAGEILTEYGGCTYGCIHIGNLAVVKKEGDPFFEVTHEFIKEYIEEGDS